MPELHAKLSPSAAERWFKCPGSLVLSRDMPGKSSVYADEGTQAHAYAEAVLTGKPRPDVPEEMIEHVQTYIEAVQDLEVPGCGVFIEERVKIADDLWGTADAVVWNPATKTLHVRDLKYGAGVGVEVSDNLQLKIYALATLLTFKFPAETVNVGIVQPRYSHSDGPCRSKDYDVVDLIDFHADVLDAVKRVERAALDYKSNQEVYGYTTQHWIDNHLALSEKGCRFCPAAPVCPKQKQKAQELAKQVFAVGKPYEPAALAETLTFLDILEGWIKNTRQFAYEEAERGETVPGWKLVEKRATRKWKDEEAAGAALEAIGCEPWERKLITPSVAEKQIGKANRSILDELTIKESSGHTLVPDSDKREAVRLDAKSAFQDA